MFFRFGSLYTECMAQSAAVTHLSIPGPKALAKEAWEIYKKRVFTIAGIAVVQFLLSFAILLVGVILGVILFFVLGGKPTTPIFVIGGVLLFIVLVAEFYLSLWFLPAYSITYRDWQKPSGIVEIIKASRAYMRATLLTGIISGLLVLGAVFAFVVPAIVFRMWFMFWIFVVIIDKRQGLSALHTSREYVRGRFWQVVGRVIVVHLPEIALSILIGAMSNDSMGGGGGVGMQLISLALMPFYGAYMYAIFMHLKKSRGDVPAVVPQKSKQKYLAVALLGYALFILGAIFVVPQVAPVVQNLINQRAEESSMTTTPPPNYQPGQNLQQAYPTSSASSEI